MSKSKGFTLIELMIVVAIIGILVAVALPSYRSFVLKSHRTDAINGLLDAASRQARYYTINNTYSADMVTLGYPNSVSNANINPVPSLANRYYDVSVLTNTAATATAPAKFTLKAAAAGTQANDLCGDFTYDDLGNKGVSGTATVASCWGT